MFNMRFDYLISEYMVYCRSRQLREKTMNSYEQALRLFERWCYEQMNIDSVDKITESIVRKAYAWNKIDRYYKRMAFEILLF